MLYFNISNRYLLSYVELGYLLLKEHTGICTSDNQEENQECAWEMAILVSLLFLMTGTLAGIGYGFYVLARQSECMRCFFSNREQRESLNERDQNVKTYGS